MARQQGIKTEAAKGGTEAPPGEERPPPATAPTLVSPTPEMPEAEAVAPPESAPAELVETQVLAAPPYEASEPEAAASLEDEQPALATAPTLVSPIPAPVAIAGPGGRIGRYEIWEELGRGAMGIVYKAYDPNTDRFVALKVLQPISGPRAGEFEQRFWREARAAGRLDHPNIVRVYDADVAQGRWYIAMEYLEGRTLEEIIASEGSQSLEQVAGIVTRVCDALNHAHECQVIHRDIKPSNIMILQDGQVKVTDFGIARVVSESSLTQAGERWGTPNYMSPEQARGAGDVDGRSDIFSLGAVVYELLTGELLFPGYLSSITSEPVDLSKLSGAFPDSVHQILEKALAKDANARFSTCAEFSEAWEHLCQALSSPRQYDPALSEGMASPITRALAEDPVDRFPTAKVLHQAFEKALTGRTVHQPPPSPSPLPLSPALGVFIAVAGAVLVVILALALGGSKVGSVASTPGQQVRASTATAQLTVPPQPIASLTPFPIPTRSPTLPPAPTSLPTSLPPPPSPVNDGIFIEYIASSANSVMREMNGRSKQDVIRNALTRHWQSLPPGLNVGLRVYGSRYHAVNESDSCLDTQLLVAPGTGPAGNLVGQLDNLEANGLAPLTEALYKAVDDFSYTGFAGAIILVADSADNCERNPCDWARTQIRDADLPLQVHVVGVGVDDEAHNQLTCLADSSGGSYRDVYDEGTLLDALDEMAGRIMQGAME